MKRGCGIHFYEVNALLSAQTQMTGRRGTGEEKMNQVYVSQIGSAVGDDEPTRIKNCRSSCQADPKCVHFTLFGPNFEAGDKNICVLNYGPPLANVRQLGIPIGPNQNATGFGSGPRNCKTP